MYRNQWFGRIPWILGASASALVAAGWLGIARSEELVGSDGRLLRAQIVWSFIAGIAMVAAAVPNYRRICRISYLLFGVSLIALLLVYFFPAVNGARRWIRLFGIGFQPSEFAKVAFILMLARYLMYRDNFRRLRGLLVPLALSTVPAVLILREPDLGTAVLFFPLLLILLAVAGARRRDLAIVLATGLLLQPFIWSQMSREQRSRVTTLFHQSDPDSKVSGDGYHLAQAKTMIALGGMWGSFASGEVTSDRTVYHVPEGATDSIFVILGERFGLVGVSALLLLYVLLVWSAILISERTREPFGRLSAAGIGALFGIQAIINTGMMVGLLPITGLSLPLVSYGGSGLVAHGLALGLLLNISLRPGYEIGEEPFRFAKNDPNTK